MITRIVYFLLFLGVCHGFALHGSATTVLSQQRKTHLRMAITSPVRYSSNDWIKCMSSLPTSRILARTKFTISWFTGWAALLTVLHKVLRMHWLQIPQSLTAILGPTISLLLVFRTNSSYDRFWEARKAQSSMLHALRTIATHASVHIPEAHWRELATLLTVFAIVQKQHLQGMRNDVEFTPLLSPERVAELQGKNNRPLFVLQQLEKLIHFSLLSKYREEQLVALAKGAPSDPMPRYIEKHFIEGLHGLSAQLVACERILKQPVPLSYSRHTSRFLSLYLFLLPLSLVPSMGWLAIPLTTAITWSLVSIQEISHFIEEPFDPTKQVIQLSHIISVAWRDVSELLGGVISNPAMEDMDNGLMQETLKNSRDMDVLEWPRFYVREPTGDL